MLRAPTGLPFRFIVSPVTYTASLGYLEAMPSVKDNVSAGRWLSLRDIIDALQELRQCPRLIMVNPVKRICYAR